MLKESYMANMKNLPGSALIIVTRTAGHVLSPSWELLNDYKHGKINWDSYEKRFKQEMKNDICIAEMRKIKYLAKNKDVYLICFEKSGHCHRHVLKKMIEELDEDVNKPNII